MRVWILNEGRLVHDLAMADLRREAGVRGLSSVLFDAFEPMSSD